MKFPGSTLVIAFASLALLTVAEPRASFAQTTGNTPTRPKGVPATTDGVMVASTVGVTSAGIRIMVGAPFSAEQESERSHVLADGTHVTQTSHVRMYRDSEGRTRNDGLLPGESATSNRAPQMVQILDPVAKVRYRLDVQRQIAHRYAFSVPEERLWRIEPPQAEGPDQSAPARVERAPAQTAATQTRADETGETVRRKVSRASLGTQTIEGIETAGTQTTITIPAGAEGNDRPIEIVCENWESPELKLQMLSKCTDPLHGDHTTRIVSIDRSEPDQSLFQVPADFRVVDLPSRSEPAVSAPDTTTSTER
ncbi:MAG: hypothetical protein WBQ08_23690 [Candidatus Sulfotelmatobacter sp.]